MGFFIKETKHGRGVFTDAPIPEGTLIEECPVVEIPLGSITRTKEGTVRVPKASAISPMVQLSRYTFFWTQSLSALALGNGSLYNHENLPNMRPVPNYQKRTISFFSLRDIKKGEELTINYQYKPTSKASIQVEKEIEALSAQECSWYEKLYKKNEDRTLEMYRQLLESKNEKK